MVLEWKKTIIVQEIRPEVRKPLLTQAFVTILLVTGMCQSLSSHSQVYDGNESIHPSLYRDATLESRVEVLHLEITN